MPDQILFVDDEPALLQGYQRLLHKEFKITTAVGGEAALTLVQHMGPFAVVLSDMRMPGMNGIEFLFKVKTLAPDTVRIMLTGAAELKTAMDAVNEGNIFRFLTKPSNKDMLVRTLNDALAQHHLLCAEKELLEKTLRSTVYALTEVLSVVSPAAFSRAMRVRRYVQRIVARLSLASPWKFEVAAMLSQLGCVTLDPEIIDKVYAGTQLSPEEEAQYVTHPRAAHDLLRGIPRLEAIAWMVSRQYEDLPGEEEADVPGLPDARLGARILRAALTFDSLLRKRHSRVDAAHYLTQSFKGLDKRIIEALMELEPEAMANPARPAFIEDLAEGAILDQDIRTPDGLLVAAKGQEVSFSLLRKLRSYREKGTIPGEVAASQPAASTPAGNA
ncbi:MAG TPA: HD domain-containing phosphohydrolase [Terriglobia bacterium]|nr:HD domain-containing phosphohydrolase [Terriglobia bacterium]